MKIQKLHIQNYKSLVDLQIIEPNPFTVFAGSNGAGKSNIFEAIEFFQRNQTSSDLESTFRMFGGSEGLVSRKAHYISEHINMRFHLTVNSEHALLLDIAIDKAYKTIFVNASADRSHKSYDRANEVINEATNPAVINVLESYVRSFENTFLRMFSSNFSRLFINNQNITRVILKDNLRLNADCSNLENVLKRILNDTFKREEILSWLDLLIPGFDNIEIVSEPLSGTDSLIIYEKGTNKPFTKNLLSDGTWNILALLTAAYQSDEPQFLCIEEPENGLNPKVQKELINLFRQKCKDEGHYIWLNTHSQTIVNQLEPKELILVDKVDGATQIKQFPNFDLHGLQMDEAWLTNSLGGGLPW